MQYLNITIQPLNNEFAIKSQAFSDNEPLFNDNGKIFTIVESYSKAVELVKNAIQSHNASNSKLEAVFNKF